MGCHIENLALNQSENTIDVARQIRQNTIKLTKSEIIVAALTKKVLKKKVYKGEVTFFTFSRQQKIALIIGSLK